jgi:hypothetical protein
MKMSKSIKRRLYRAKNLLHQTINKILEINVQRKRMQEMSTQRGQDQWEDELRVLNKIAAQQAKLIRLYERELDGGQRQNSSAS